MLAITNWRHNGSNHIGELVQDSAALLPSSSLLREPDKAAEYGLRICSFATCMKDANGFPGYWIQLAHP